MLSYDTILKSKDTEKCLTQLLSFNRKIIQTSISKKLYKKVKIKGKRETWSKLENLYIPNKLVKLKKIMSRSIKEKEQLSETV